MLEKRRLGSRTPRSAGSIPQRRIPQAWPKDRRFRILSIDGGGIRGIFPAAVLAELERRYTGGRSIASYFDLVAGTSTGGILGLGLGSGYTGADLCDLYVRRGCKIFPPAGRLKNIARDAFQFAHYIYDRGALERLLIEKLDYRLFGDSSVRLCIPAFEGTHSEVFVFKTPHHVDYQIDRHERMIDVGLATSAAPSYFRALEHGGYTLVDGGVWANNPVMLAVVEALTAFDIARDQIDVLTLGCGEDKYVVSGKQISMGGLWHWRKIMEGAMRLQSLAATNQVRLLLGPPSVVRIDAPAFEPKLRMDDWRRCVDLLLPAAQIAAETNGVRIAETFLKDAAAPFVPCPTSV